MAIQTDLFTVATSGVNASNTLLNTTGTNIANMNTQGYVRQDTQFIAQANGGLGRGVTERVLNTFAQNQLRRDTSSVAELSAYSLNTSGLDNILANEANSVTKGMSELFAAMQTAADDPTNLPSRDLVMGQAQQLLGRIGGIADFMNDAERELNLQFQNEVQKANGLIQTIVNLNETISVSLGSSSSANPNILMNERDLAVLQLSEIIAIETRESSTGTGGINVNLSSGEALVMDTGRFNVLSMGSDPDNTFQRLELNTQFDSNSAKINTAIYVAEDNLGGSLGGLFSFRNDVLSPTMRELGQVTVAIADSINQQNQLGMDLDQQLGGDIFAIPTFNGLNYLSNNDLTSRATGRVIAGQSHELTDSDYRITITSDPTTTAPSVFDIQVEALNADGQQTLDQNNEPIVATYTVSGQSGVFNEILGGVELEFASGSNYAQGDQFLFQPTRKAAAEVSMATTRPEDLAFASPMRVEIDINNLGDATVKSSGTTNTNSADNTFLSAFNTDGTLDGAGNSPHPTLGAPTQIVFTTSDSYQVRDSSNNVITTVTGVTQYDNLLAQAADTADWPSEFSSLNDYPGYDFSLQGEVRSNDRFTLTFNTDGVSDNTNAVAMADLQKAGNIKISNNDTGSLATFHEAYSNLVGKVGEASGRAEISLQAASVMKNQAQDWFDSVSGVSLDEEAANLIRFQQSYAAAARIITTARELFDTILAAAR